MWQSLKNIYHLAKASAAVFYYRFPAKDLVVIGVTGTDGKTTTSTLIYQMLKAANMPVALISTVAAYIGNEQIDTGFHVTSPEPVALQQLLRKIKDSGIVYVVLEATSHGLDQHRLLGTNIQIGVLTNITHEHLDYHKTYANYVQAKAKLFKNTKVAIINSTDQSYPQIKPLLPADCRVISYPENAFEPTITDAIKTAFSQHYNQLNATAATLVARELSISPKNIIKALKSFPGVPGRMQRIANNKGLKLIVDFAHTPNALANALTALKQTTKGKLIAVYGCAGLRDHTKRPLMGKVGADIADEVVLTAEDPRTESVWNILDQMTATIDKNIGHVFKIPDRQQAINFAISIAKKGDTVGVFGKGHEQSMCFGTTETPWSDVNALEKALKN